MIELYLSKVTETSESEQAGKLYARVSYKETLNVQDMAHHMAEHNTMFSEGSITGILIDFVKCVREQVLMGNTVKIDNLAIFKATVEANGLETLYDADADKVASASIGTLAEGAKTGPAVKVIKLLAQSTGDFTRDELKKAVKFAWTDKTKADIAAAKAASGGSAGNGSADSGNSGSQNSGSQSGSGNQSGSEQGGSSQQGSGSQQEQQNTLAKPTISGVTPFTESTEVTMSGPEDAEIYYTTDGSTPSAQSTLYEGSFTLSDTTTVKAIAIKNGESSEVTTKLFSKGTGDEPGGSDH
ncbi:MAG: chitobiase/beta-hexosaminidase C-terminal domain-containing protein [Prevotella sp.]|nr:chitobiase/beta-hexosaminidase C-terminal domain-containing protein [Prevotella sp.]